MYASTKPRPVVKRAHSHLAALSLILHSSKQAQPAPLNLSSYTDCARYLKHFLLILPVEKSLTHLSVCTHLQTLIFEELYAHLVALSFTLRSTMHAHLIRHCGSPRTDLLLEVGRTQAVTSHTKVLGLALDARLAVLLVGEEFVEELGRGIPEVRVAPCDTQHTCTV